MKSRFPKKSNATLVLSWAALLGLSGCEVAPFKSLNFSMSNKSWSVPTMARLKSQLKGQIDSSLLGDHLAIRVSEDERHVIISLPTPNLFQNWEREIPQLPGAKLKAFVNKDERSFLELYYPLYLLISDFSNWKTSRLPNGKAIPGLPKGEAPGLAYEIDKDHKVNIFFDKGIVALLLNVPYDPLLATTIPVKNRLGNVFTIPKEDSSNGGLLLSLVLPLSVMQSLEGE